MHAFQCPAGRLIVDPANRLETRLDHPLVLLVWEDAQVAHDPVDRDWDLFDGPLQFAGQPELVPFHQPLQLRPVDVDRIEKDSIALEHIPDRHEILHFSSCTIGGNQRRASRPSAAGSLTACCVQPA